jgi:hypothetical protein
VDLIALTKALAVVEQWPEFQVADVLVDLRVQITFRTAEEIPDLAWG